MTNTFAEHTLNVETMFCKKCGKSAHAVVTYGYKCIDATNVEGISHIVRAKHKETIRPTFEDYNPNTVRVG